MHFDGEYVIAGHKHGSGHRDEWRVSSIADRATTRQRGGGYGPSLQVESTRRNLDTVQIKDRTVINDVAKLQCRISRVDRHVEMGAEIKRDLSVVRRCDRANGLRQCLRTRRCVLTE